ncbi:hypothetical protein M5K25_021099 [Dendrobium thyrsiflorum]|uniref:Uncharacterized protein n=1 Tax=Dendrobium thyrsiflorum TaxID=117978 RepID=A0ABD0UBI5_DENTH
MADDDRRQSPEINPSSTKFTICKSLSGAPLIIKDNPSSTNVGGFLKNESDLGKIKKMIFEDKGLSYKSNFIANIEQRKNDFEASSSTVIKHLPRVTSDHGPLLINLFNSVIYNQKSIRFENVWGSYEASSGVVLNAWWKKDFGYVAHILQRKVSSFLKNLFFWSKNKLKCELQIEIIALQEEESIHGLYLDKLLVLRKKIHELNTTLARLSTWLRKHSKSQWNGNMINQITISNVDTAVNTPCRYNFLDSKTPFSALVAHRKTNSYTFFPNVVGKEPGAVPTTRRAFEAFYKEDSLNENIQPSANPIFCQRVDRVDRVLLMKSIDIKDTPMRAVLNADINRRGRGTCPLIGGFAVKWHRRINGYDSGPSEPGDSPPNGTTKLWLWPAPNSAFTVQLGCGARIQLANAIIEIGNAGATIQFGSLDFPAVVSRTAVVPVNDMNTGKPARRPHSAETSARHAHLSAPQATIAQDPRRRISVFERLSQSEAPATKRVVIGGIVSVVTANTTTLPTGSPASGNNNVETSSSGGRLTRRQRRKRNAELRAQQQFSTHPSNVPAQELEATIPTQNGFSNLKWVRKNSSTGELKKSFWEQKCEVPTPPKKKEPESLSARVYRVLRTVKEKGLTKKRFQRPLAADVRRIPPRERLSFARVERTERRNNPLGEHRGVTPELHIRGSTTERSRWKGKQVWRPRPRRDDERKEREMDLGVTSGAASRRSASTNKQHQKWVQKKTHDDTYPDGRHFGESSKESCRSLTPPKEDSNFDRSPQLEEVFFPNHEPEIQWPRRSEIRIPEEEEKEDMKEEEEEHLKDEYYMEYEQEELNDTINMEVVYMVRHIEAEYDYGEDDGDWQPHPQQEYQHQHEAGSIAGGGDRSLRRQEMEVEENLFDDENATLADMRRQMRRQMRAKDKEISQLNEKMTEMMAQMTAMMQMMQRTAAAGTIPNPPTDPPILRMSQVSGVRGTPEGGHETHNVIRQPTPQNIASTSEPVTAAQKNDKKPVQEEKWETAVSKKTAKMLKQLEGVPDVKWKSPTEPVFNLKGLPKVQASTSKQHLSQASSSKPGKPKFFKKKTKLKKPREKKTVTQKVIDSLDEYYQTVRQPIKLGDFMSELKIEEIEEDGDANPLPTEVCRVISVIPSTPVSERKEAPESCMMVLPMDCSSEKDLYFPEEGESDPDIASQMEHVNLGDFRDYVPEPIELEQLEVFQQPEA